MTAKANLDPDATLSEYLKYHGEQLMKARAGKLEFTDIVLDEMVKCIAVSTMLAENLEEETANCEQLIRAAEIRAASKQEGTLQ